MAVKPSGCGALQATQVSADVTRQTQAGLVTRTQPRAFEVMLRWAPLDQPGR